jgi:PAS domain S-box-containing protein
MLQELRILLVDDNPYDRHLVLREIRKAYPQALILQALDQAQFDQVISENAIDVVVTDYHLHWSSGIEVLRSVKARLPHCPVIMFTGTGSEEVAVEAMKHGLDDYIIKSVNHLVRLRAAVESVVEHSRDRARAEATALRLDLLLSHLNVGVFSCAADGRVLELNDALLRIMPGHQLDEARQRQLADLFECSAPVRQLIERVAASATRQECEIEQSDAGGNLRNYRVVASLLVDSERSGRIEGMVEDITDRKQAEARAQAAAVAAAQLAMLSPREREVLDLIVTGDANKVVARRLDISEKTVEKHRASLMRKVNARSVAELVRMSMSAGIVGKE